MKPIRKQFDPNSSFPLQIVYKDTKRIQDELPYHFHDWYELIFVHRGKGTSFIDQSVRKMEGGNVFVIPGNTIHRVIPDEKTPATSTAIYFNPLLITNRFLGDTFSYLQIFEESLRSKSYKYILQKDQQRHINTLLDQIYFELTNKEMGYRHAALTHVQLLLLFLSRTMIKNPEQNSQSTHLGPSWMKDILEYLEQHFTDKITLEMLSSHSNVSIAHLSRVFKETTGLNISEYITTKRILKAKELLLRTNDKIAAIAEQCGFESMPHFHRTFKKYIGHTPADYRKNANYNKLKS
ncbi:AraC family transcriptional regulator [Bacillus sp. Marseille-P3661]|uniref:AraC family transcriptional regulator n=1 Tax=Bacillus sp. Marseille-P3661 TaxID=1936234 RepID=UPI000C822861|nr:AraC family transcriptional regulator [Bacillus sp. Marseille-P3661]